MSDKPQTLSPDKPLSDPNLDRFNYAPVAKKLAVSIQKMSPPEGLVIGIYGEWGLGKSTFIEFVVHYLEQLPEDEQLVIMRFNPWWFSGGENLVKHFFDQLLSTLGNKFHNTVKGLTKSIRVFSRAVAEVPLPSAGIASVIADAIPDISQRDVISLKKDIGKKLKKAGKRILVIIDDIDRLDPDEIKQLFTVIKAIADFPNMLYLVGFDRKIVSDAMGSKGEEFLEKIVQVSFDLPRPSTSQLELLFLENITRIYGELPREFAINKYLQKHGYLFHLSQILNTPRKITRIINALYVTYAIVEDEVNSADFIAIETIRLFYPDVYDVIRKNKFIFTGQTDDSNKSFYANFIQSNNYPVYVRDLLELLFPKLGGGYGYDEQKWRKELKICSPDVFDTYFSFTIPSDRISNSEIKAVLSTTNDTAKFSQQLNIYFDTNPEKVRSLLQSIDDHSEQAIHKENIPAIITSILDIGDKLCGLDKLEFFDVIGRNEYSLLSILTTLIRRIDRNQQFPTLKDPLDKGNANFLGLKLIVEIEHLHKRFIDQPSNFYNEDNEILKKEDIPALEEIAIKKIHKVIATENFFKARHKFTVLHLWIYIQAEEAHKWIDEKLKDPSLLIEFIRDFFDLARSSLSEAPELDENILTFVQLDIITSRIRECILLNIFDSAQLKIANAFLLASENLKSKNN